jgi:hypothetical protein
LTLADVGSEKEYPIVPDWLPTSDVIFGEMKLDQERIYQWKPGKKKIKLLK